MATMMKQGVIYTAKARTTGGRDGESRTSDGRLAVKLATPGTSGTGTNPEQLFAAGWSACFESAMAAAAHERKVVLPAETGLDAEIDLRRDEGEYSLAARLAVSVPGMSRDVAQAIVDDAERTCPYSKAIRGNVPVSITLM